MGIIGIYIIQYFVGGFLRATAGYDGYVNFWYFSHNIIVSIAFAVLMLFAIFGLTIYPLYMPKTLPGVIVGYGGILLFSVGYALTINMSPWGYSIPDTALVGYGIAILGAIVLQRGFKIGSRADDY